MKKILISIAILLMATTAFAKSPKGLNVGGGFANNFMTFETDNESFFGGFAEVGYNLKFGKTSGLYFGARGDMLYNTQYSYGYGPSVDAISRLVYLDVPIKYAFEVGGRTKFFFDLGPTVNFWLGARTHVEARSGSVTLSETKRWFDQDIFNRVNLSLGGNIGVKIGHAKVYAGYDQGLFSFTKTDKVGYNNVGQLRIGFAWVW